MLRHRKGREGREEAAFFPILSKKVWEGRGWPMVRIRGEGGEGFFLPPDMGERH